MWETFKQKLSSRKFLMALGNSILILLNEGLELGIPTEVYWYLFGIAGAYIIGESWVDSKKQ